MQCLPTLLRFCNSNVFVKTTATEYTKKLDLVQVRDTETGLVETNNLKEEPEEKAKVFGEVFIHCL